MPLANFNIDEQLLAKFDDTAKELDLTRTELLTALVEWVVRLTRDADFAERAIGHLLSLANKSDRQPAKESAQAYAEAYKRAKKAR